VTTLTTLTAMALPRSLHGDLQMSSRVRDEKAGCVR
jgi:hypothetical protein